MKKFATMAISVTLIGAMVAGGSLAYLTSTDSEVNTMTLGNVKIQQLEYERVVENGEWVPTGDIDKYGYEPDQLQEFVQDKPLYPAVFADGVIKWDDRNGSQEASGAGSHQQSWAQVGAPGSNQLFDASVKNAQDKFVFVKNTGRSDAYVRTLIALEQGNIATDDFYNVIMTSANGNHWSWKTVATDVNITDKDGVTGEYFVIEAEYLGATSNPTGILAPGTVSYPSLLQVYMKPEATNADVKAIDGNKNGKYDILVLSQAVQTAGFENAEAALTAAFPYGENNVNLISWFGEMPKENNGYVVKNGEELQAAIENGETELSLEAGTYQMPAAAKGKTLTIYGTKDAVIEHVNQGEDGMNYNLEGSTVVFNGVTIKTTSGTYRGFARSAEIEYNECNFVGSYTLGAGSHTFNDCHFNLQNNYVWTWGGTDVVFNGCTFEDENGVGKAILVHNTVDTEVTVKDCNFVATTGAKTWDGIDVAAVSIDPNGAHTAKVTFEGTNDVSTAFNGNWQIKYVEDTALVTVVE